MERVLSWTNLNVYVKVPPKSLFNLQHWQELAKREICFPRNQMTGGAPAKEANIIFQESAHDPPTCKLICRKQVQVVSSLEVCVFPWAEVINLHCWTTCWQQPNKQETPPATVLFKTHCFCQPLLTTAIFFFLQAGVYWRIKGMTINDFLKNAVIKKNIPKNTCHLFQFTFHVKNNSLNCLSFEPLLLSFFLEFHGICFSYPEASHDFTRVSMPCIHFLRPARSLIAKILDNDWQWISGPIYITFFLFQ